MIESLYQAATGVSELSAEAISVLERDEPVRIVLWRDGFATLRHEALAREVIGIVPVAGCAGGRRLCHVICEAGIFARERLREVAGRLRRRRVDRAAVDSFHVHVPAHGGRVRPTGAAAEKRYAAQDSER